MEGYIPPADNDAAPGNGSNQGEPTTPTPAFGASSGEMYATTRPSTTSPNFGDSDPRRDTFSNEGVITNQLDEVAGQQEFVTSSNFLDMSKPTFSSPGADFLLAEEYVVGGVTYDPGEVLDCDSFPELEAERNARISEILRNLHQRQSTSKQFVPKVIPTSRPSVGMTRDSVIRQENLRLWREELFNDSFYHTREPIHPVRVKSYRLKMADGRIFRRDQPIDQRFSL